MVEPPAVAYLSMEIALESRIPTYSGGLGVLAGDTLRSAADLALPMAAVTLAHRRGYFRQHLDADGWQGEAPAEWQPERHAEPLEPRVEVELQGRNVTVRAWRYDVNGESGSRLPVYLLDSDLPENDEADRRLTDRLYGGDDRYRLCQEAILGIGGVRMLRALGHTRIERFHLNEGHAALAILALVEERGDAALEEVRRACVFTTHTPVPAGHDKFEPALVRSVLGEARTGHLAALGQEKLLNLTDLALHSSHFVNGVAMRHGEVSQGMFPGYPIRSITNGVHPGTWVSAPFRGLFDRHIPGWRRDPFSLRYAVGIPLREIDWAQQAAKRSLVAYVNRACDVRLRTEAFTLGFARRATAYKRSTLLFHDPERLASLAAQHGPVQVVMAGKAHPADQEGKRLIASIFGARERLRGRVEVAYLPEYGMELGRLLCSGCDVWLNTPVPPLEASGTSGMKAALNGVPSLSVLDGWWLEGCVEGMTGWAIGNDDGPEPAPGPKLDAEHAEALYTKLGGAVLPRYYGDPEGFLEMRRHAIALNASFFNTQRMLLQYLYEAYLAPVSGSR